MAVWRIVKAGRAINCFFGKPTPQPTPLYLPFLDKSQLFKNPVIIMVLCF